nr:DNA-directed DNA polymerase II small subunit [Candidatus Njordarchaeum guaymaensis]
MSDKQKTQNAVRTLLRAGVQLSPDALSYLSLQPDPIEVASKTLEELGRRETKPLVITRNILEEMVPRSAPSHFRIVDFDDSNNLAFSSAGEVAVSLEVLSPLYEDSSSEGKLDDFIAYFQNRYEKMKRLFRARKDSMEAVTIREASGGDEGSKAKIIGLVTSKRETERGMIILELEDLTGTLSATVSNRDDKLYHKGSRVLLDQVIRIDGTIRADKTASVREITWADVPYDRRPNHAKEPVFAVLISDIHYGSAKFLKDQFEEFVGWIRGEGPTDEAAKMAKRVKYLVIAGDLVDGIGVYPNQEDELEVKDIYEQYGQLADYIKKIPSTIEIIAIPGNHDATRLALPQPPIPEKYVGPITKSCTNFHMIGNPGFVKIHGVDTLVYHGRIIDNILSTLPEISSRTVTQALHELVRCRHIAPTWDPNNPIVPTSEDLLVMERVPDILHMGHIHINAVSQYRGVLTVNSGAFQSQTSYQRGMGVKPTPGIVEIVNLMTLKPAQIVFSAENQ